MKSKTLFFVLLAALLVTSIMAVILARDTVEDKRSMLQRSADMIHSDITTEHGTYGHYRIYTGMLLCKDCDSIATRIILKSETASSTEGVATLETTKIYTGDKPQKQPLQKVMWEIQQGLAVDAAGSTLLLSNNATAVANFSLDPAGTALGKIIIEAGPDGSPLSSKENRVGKLILVSEGDTSDQ